MKKLVNTNLTKKIIAILLTIAILLPSLPLSVFAANDENDNTFPNDIEDKVTISANWRSGNEIEEGLSGDTFTLDYSYSFNGVLTGFQDVKIFIETDDVRGVVDQVLGGQYTGPGYAMTAIPSVNSGTNYNGTAGVVFNNHEEYKNRKVYVRITGTYKDGDDTISFQVKKGLDARITPKDKQTTYNSSLEYQTSGSSRLTETVTGNRISLGNNQYGRSIGWYTDTVTATYPIRIFSTDFTQKLELNIKINRYDNTGTNKLSEGYTVNWDGLDTDFDSVTQTTDSTDGSITYTFIKGQDADTLDKDNCLSAMDKNYNIVVTYQTPHTNPTTETTPEKSSNFILEGVLNATGFNTVKRYGEEEAASKVTNTSRLTSQKNLNLYSYTPGLNAWLHADFGEISISNSEAKSGLITTDIINSLKNNENVDLNVNLNLSKVDGIIGNEQVGLLQFRSPILVYYNDAGKLSSKTLNENQIYLSAITEYAASDSVSYLVNGANRTEFNGEYSVPSGNKFNSFSAEMNNFLTNKYNGYSLKYKLNGSQLGLSETEMQNIQSIGISLYTSGSEWLQPGYQFVNIAKANEQTENKYSYFELEVTGGYDAQVTDINKVETKTIKLTMRKNTNVFRDTNTVKNYVVNVNPVFYVSLPQEFEYVKLDGQTQLITATMPVNPYLSIEKTKYVKKNGNLYLAIYCKGTYDSSIDSSRTITVTLNRKLKRGEVSSGTIYADMITDNENYYRKSKNNNEFAKDNLIPEYVFRESLNYAIVGENEISAHTIIEDTVNEKIKEYVPNSDEQVDKGELENPVAVKDGAQATYKARIRSTGSNSLTNITILNRLPFEGNTTPYDNTTPIVPADKTRNTLTNLNIVGVFEGQDNSENEKIVNPSQYKIYYSTQADATFDSTGFVEYEEGVSDLSQAKNIKVVLDDSYVLESGKNVFLKYKMTMPSDAGEAGAISAVKYITVSDKNSINEEQGTQAYEEKLEEKSKILYSPAVYVENGDPNGTVIIQKKFEDYPVGKSSTTDTLANIQFKLQYFDQNDELQFLKDTNSQDIVATTDSTGVATFNSVPQGQYILYEATTFTNYSGLEQDYLITVGNAETVNVTAVNLLKRGTIKITKNWRDVENYFYKGYASSAPKFGIRWQKSDNNQVFTYAPTAKAVTSTSNEVIYENVPYGKYTITETFNDSTWVKETASQTNKILSSDLLETTFTNRLATGTVQIVKTVPAGETVDGLTFHVVGRGNFNWEDAEGITHTTDSEYTIKIGDTYPSNVSVVKSENDTKATITISNQYMGLYTVEETSLPKIDGTDIEKYVKTSGSTMLTSNGQTAIVNINNKYKYGKIEINKTAKLKDGDTYTDIGDLSNFKVRVTGTSYYGNEIDAIISLDENGYGLGKFEIGEYTITEVPQDGYTAYYGEDATATTTPPTVTLDYNRTVTQKIYNEHTGKGYVRVEKSLEGVTDPQRVLDAGIQFKIVGQNIAGGRVNETITINQIDTTKNVAYGVSNAISAGGEYELQEVESTVPEYYEAIEPQAINISTSNTQQQPLVIEAVNSRMRGNLEVVTETNPAGGPLKNITYRVTEVKINSNGTYTKVGTPVTVEGSNEDVNTSFAELRNIYAGHYLVEQVTIPDGWIKDVNQVVEVPGYNTGYANFVITAQKELPKNTLTINKVILNEEGTRAATAAEISAAGLDANQSFEVKIKNENTNKEYYVFTSPSKPGVIQGLDAGTYSIEEVFKPKYTTEGYYNIIEVAPSIDPGNGDQIEIQYAEQKIEVTEGKYIFTIPANNEEVEDVELTVKNKINTKFGFGGQTEMDNLSKETAPEGDTTYVTKTVIYVVDEDNKAISGAVFRLLDSNGNPVTIDGLGAQFEVANKRLVIKGLPVGTYTLECVEYPAGYLKPENKQIIVYSDATQVSRVEIQKDIPRGSFTLSTVYKVDDTDATNYTSRSKYKVVNPETGELVKFVRTATGDYRKSNLETASPIIVLKSGPVEIEGIETGDYEIGIVDVTPGFGIKSEDPENVTIIQNTNSSVSVEVVKKNIVQVGATEYASWYLDESGDMYVVGYDNRNGIFGNGTTNVQTSQFIKIEFPEENVNIVKFSATYSGVVALDSNGKVWAWGNNSDGKLATGSSSSTAYTPTYVADGIKDIACSGNSTLWLTNDGYVWSFGHTPGNGTSTAAYGRTSPIMSLIESGVKVEKLAELSGDSSYDAAVGIIDTDGKVWTWGDDRSLVGMNTSASVNTPVCISDVTDLNGVVIKDLLFTDIFAMALDSNGEIWLWGYASDVLTLIGGSSNVPVKVSSSYFGNSKITSIGGSTNVATVIDEKGRVWTWGEGSYGKLGNGTKESSSTPICISDNENEMLYNIKIKDIAVGRYNNNHVVAVDTQNRLWAWGGDSRYGQAGTSVNGQNSTNNYITIPRIITNTYNAHLEYNLKFIKIFQSYNSHNNAIDEEGKLWVWGRNNYNCLGIQNGMRDISVPTVLDVPGDPKMKKMMTSGYDQSIFLSEDGRVFIAGTHAAKGDGTSSTYSGIGITEITDNFNLPDDAKIIDVYVCQYCYIALDSNGKVYTWGGGNTLGRTSDATRIECISDDDNEVLNGVKIIKLSYNQTSADYVLALADNGDVYTWGSSSYTTTTPSLTVSGKNFVDVQNDKLIDSNGKLWEVYMSSGNTILTCLNDKPTSPIYKYGKIYENYKIEEVYTINDTSNVIFKDSNGKYWKCAGSQGYSITEVNININDIDEIYGNLVLDSYGQIWKLDSSYNPTLVISNVSKGVVNNPEVNELYGVKVKQLINDRFVIDENDDVWFFNVSGAAINLSKEEKGDQNPLYGKEIIRVITKDYVETSDHKLYYIGGEYPAEVLETMSGDVTYVYQNYSPGYEFYIAVDNNGKLWTCGTNTSGYLGNGGYTTNGVPVCLNDIEGSELQIANARFTRNKKTYGGLMMIDDNGKLWYWGGTNPGDGTSTRVLSPTCVTDRNADLSAAYTDNNIKIESYFRVNTDNYLNDSEGGIWKMVSNSWVRTNNNGLTGIYYDETNKNWKDAEGEVVELSGTTWKRFTELHNGGALTSSQKAVKTINLRGSLYAVLTADGDVYMPSRTSGEYQLTRTYNTAMSVIHDVKNIEYIYNTYASNYYSFYVLAETESGIYVIFNYYRSGYTSTLQRHIVNSSTTVKEVIKTGNGSSSDAALILSDDGNLYAYGYQTNKLIPFRWDSNTYINKSLTTTEGSPFYNMTITDIEYDNSLTYRVYVTNSEGEVYTWIANGSSSTAPVPELLTKYDAAITELYGEVNNDLRKKFINSSMATTTGTLFMKDNKIYDVRLVGTEIQIKEVDLTSQFVNGIGNITSVVGEREIQTEDGDIYQVVATGSDTYELQKVDEATPFETAEPGESPDLSGITVVKQTKHKALDNQGKLYVWDEFTGLKPATTGLTCVTDIEYQVEPVYSTSDGWSVVKGSY